MMGGYIGNLNVSDAPTVAKTECLTDDSIRLLNQLKPIVDKNINHITKIIKPFNDGVVRFINSIQDVYSKSHKTKYTVKPIDNIFAKMVSTIDMGRYIKEEGKGSSNVYNFLKSTNRMDFANTDLGIDELLNMFELDQDTKANFKKQFRLNHNISIKDGKLFTKRYPLIDNKDDKEHVFKLQKLKNQMYYITPNTSVFDNKERYFAFSFISSDVIEDLKRDPSLIEKLYEINIGDSIIMSPIVTDDLVDAITMSKKMVKLLADEFGLEFKDSTIMLLMSNAKKYFPSIDEGQFTARSTNSAEFYPSFNQLNIFRSEEARKLILHELIHRIEMEKLIKDNNDKVQVWGKRWSIKRVDDGDILLTESVVEAMAQFINVVLTALCIDSNLDHSFNSLWINELMFGVYQTAKILYTSGFKTNKEFVTKSSDKMVIESTSTVEYHIFKTILLLNFNEFYDMYINKRIDGLLAMMYDFAKNNVEYNEIIDELIGSFKDDGSELFKTGRMSIIEQKLS